MFLDPSAQ